MIYVLGSPTLRMRRTLNLYSSTDHCRRIKQFIFVLDIIIDIIIDIVKHYNHLISI